MNTNQPSSPAARHGALTLITGASSGIGREIARECARHGHPLVIVATGSDELGAVARDLTTEFKVPVEPITQDLTQPDCADRIAAELQRRGLQPEILVNNAGVGQRGRFWEIPLEKHLEVIRLDVEAPVRLTRTLLPAMVQRGHGRILNTASIAGFQPGPLLAVYHAAKAFVLSWSEALATELADTGLTVTTLCPGPVDTDFFPRADMEETRVFQQGSVMAPQEVARDAYAALMRGERLIVPGGVNKTMTFARRFLPLSAQAKQNEKMYQDALPEKQKRARGDIEREHEAKHEPEGADYRPR